MANLDLNLACRCGATLRLTLPSTSTVTMRLEREAFDEAHAVCRERVAEAEPGPCWARAGVIWPSGNEPRCELRAGHAGAHECDRGSMGGYAVWTDPEPDDEPKEARP